MNVRFLARTEPARPATPMYKIPGVRGSSFAITDFTSPGDVEHVSTRPTKSFRTTRVLTLDNMLPLYPSIDSLVDLDFCIPQDIRHCFSCDPDVCCERRRRLDEDDGGVRGRVD